MTHILKQVMQNFVMVLHGQLESESDKSCLYSSDPWNTILTSFLTSGSMYGLYGIFNFGILFDVFFGILFCIYSDILSGINSIYSDIFSGILSGIYYDIFCWFYLTFWRLAEVRQWPLRFPAVPTSGACGWGRGGGGGEKRRRRRKVCDEI